MRDSDYIIRNYRASDFVSLVRVRNEAQGLAADIDYLSSESIRARLGRPNYVPEQDLFLVEESGVIVGYMDIAPETEIGRIVIDCFICPEHRRKGLAARLLGYASQRAKALGARVVHVNVAEGNAIARKVLAKLDFRHIRRFYELRVKLADVSFPKTPPGFPVRHFQAGEEGRLTEIQNRCFVNTWGYHPNTEEEMRYVIGHSNCDPKGILLAYQGDRPIGYCWTRIEYGGKSMAQESQGRIFMLGVDPDYRGTGLGKGLLLAGLFYLKNKGLRVAHLTVDSENRIATALYRSIGFKVYNTSLWYEKSLD